MKQIIFLLALVFVGGCFHQPKNQTMQPDRPVAAQRTLPAEGSFLADDSKMPDDFSITYEYSDGSYPDAPGFLLIAKARGESQISSGERSESFIASRDAFEALFQEMVSRNVFNTKPSAVVRWRDLLSPVYGIGGARVVLRVQADRVMVEYPSLPRTFHEDGVDIERIMDIQGFPKEFDRAALQEIIEETKNVTGLFDAIIALVPKEAYEKIVH